MIFNSDNLFKFKDLVFKFSKYNFDFEVFTYNLIFGILCIKIFLFNSVGVYVMV